MPERSLLIAITLLVCAATRTPGAKLAADQQQVAIGYERLETLALRIADAVEADDPLRAEQVRTAISEARASGLDNRFGKVVRLLEQQRYAAAKGDQAELAAQLEELLQLVMADPREARLEEQRRRLKELRREIRAALREQRSLRARAQRGQRSDVAERQKELAKRIERLQEDAAEADRLAGIPEAAGDAAPTPEGSEAQPGEQSPSESPSIQGKLQRGQQAMESAGDKLAKDQDAADDQRDAQRRLEEAQREAEERLRQIREEEQQRRLVKLAERFRRMHEAEVGLYQETTERIESGGTGSDRATLIAAAQLAARQGEVGDAADRALRLVRADGSSRVFDDVLTQTVEDIRAAEARLRGGKIDQRAADLESAVVESLADLIAAVDDSLDELEQKKKQPSPQSPGGGGGQGGENPLISKIADLRMLRSLQARLLRQTRTEHARQDGSDESAERLAQLERRQRKLASAAAEIATPAKP